MKEFWDQRYREQGFAYGSEPNLFFKDTLSGLEPGRLLLPAEGEGRNAVHAAAAGWTVDAFDFSEAGRDKALALAAERDVTINYTVASFEDAPFPWGAYDAAALIFAHVHESKRQAVHHGAIAALAPGGTLILESYSKEQLDYGTGGPPKAEMLVSLEQVREDFVALQIERLEKVEAEIQEGPYHHGLASVIRLVARKP